MRFMGCLLPAAAARRVVLCGGVSVLSWMIPTSANAQFVNVGVEKTEYSLREPIKVMVFLEKGYRPTAARLVMVRRNGREDGENVQSVDAAPFVASNYVPYPPPTVAGEYELRFVAGGQHIATSTPFRVVAPAPSGPTSAPPEGPRVRGVPGFAIRLDKTEYNVGEPIVMTTILPADFEPSWHGWSVVSQDESSAYSHAYCEWAEVLKRVPCRFPAPEHNGSYEVQFRESAGAARILATATIRVESKPARGALGASRETRRVRTGEQFDVEITLPPNRYYATVAGWGGPNLRIYRAADGNQTWAEKEIEGDWLVAVAFMQDVGNGGKFRIAVTAPDIPCRCELRLYDRYPHDRNGRPDGYLLDVQPLTVVGDETTRPEDASPTKLRFVRGPGFVPVTAFSLGDVFFIEAEFADDEPEIRTLTLEWREGQELKTKPITVRRISRGKPSLYRSDELKTPAPKP